MKVREYKNKHGKVKAEVKFNAEEWALIVIVAFAVSMFEMSQPIKGGNAGGIALVSYMTLGIFFFLSWLVATWFAINHAYKKGRVVKLVADQPQAED